jgi:hypothetical protein
MSDPVERIQDFGGLQYPFSTEGVSKVIYDAANTEYATSSHQKDHDMFPGLIAVPNGDDDIKSAIRFAKANGYAISIMSGGHQYSGACSTHGKGIQLNLRNTYLGPQDLLILPQLPEPFHDRTLVYASVSQSLESFRDFLQANKLFVPHGQCTDVHLGGHGQTGGWGQLARSFGLLGDHIWGIRLINHDAQVQEITKASDPDLFYAILGGSPGNFGVITHYTLAVHRDSEADFPGPDADGPRPRGYKAIWLYNESIVKLLLTEIAKMADDPSVPRNFDLCVSVLSASFPIHNLLPEIADNRDKVSSLLASLAGRHLDLPWPPSVVLYAQWVPLSKEDKYTPEIDAWFQKFRSLHSLWHGGILALDFEEPMSVMTGKWLFTRPREFDHPYVKRGYTTNSRTLVADGWVEKVANQIDRVLNPVHDFQLWTHCFLSCQIQCFGGDEAMFFKNRDNGTAYSWRDTTVGQTLDCFHLDSPEGLRLANEWQNSNDAIMIGPDSPFSKTDRRLLWASYGDWDLGREEVWKTYYETEEKYRRIGVQRGRMDPSELFTPKPFCVRAVRGVEREEEEAGKGGSGASGAGAAVVV